MCDVLSSLNVCTVVNKRYQTSPESCQLISQTLLQISSQKKPRNFKALTFVVFVISCLECVLNQYTLGVNRVNIEVKIVESDRCAGFTQLIVVKTKMRSSWFLTQISLPNQIKSIKKHFRGLRMAAIFYLKFLATSCLPCFQHRRTFKLDSLPVETAGDFTNVYACN